MFKQIVAPGALGRGARNRFVYWMSGNTGRLVRIGAGAALVILGWYHIREDVGILMLVGGLTMTAAGLLNFCLLAPLFHESFFGYAVRNDDPMERF